ncbi:par-3 family cell polarity regulator beta a [Cheilinus undulatus]|uniref:par-3 family cell polarity regulator beta a n=1 Tax=Cheilinus undulatus TaxID=241271 RepID=UPI001BD53A80|nr:par-3 family cell polarity regulator beta a [Cheilinus undulatus]XP_041637871.1 par-3 family cell polarity regulator beta a [Cheilinus undulatus]
MKVTVTFGDTSVVVPCKPGWNVRDLIDQATRRYHRILEQHGETGVRTHHLEYTDGGILDMDDLLSDLVEDRDKLVAVFDEVQHERADSPRETMSNGYSSATASPEPLAYYPHLQYQEPARGEIEVNEASLKANTPLLVRSSSDSALAPPLEVKASPSSEDLRNGTPEPEINHVLKGTLERLRTEDPPAHYDAPAKMSQVNFSTLTRTVEFPGNWGPLGIHVVPYCSSLSGRALGLHIKGIEENSRAKKEELFKEDECIVQINDTPLQDKTFAQSQDVFRQAMGTSSVRLEVLPASNKLRYEKSFIGQLFDDKDSAAKVKSPLVVRARTEPQPEPKQEPKPNTRVEVRQPETHAKTPEPVAAKIPPALPQSGPVGRVSPASPAPAGSLSPSPDNRSQSPLNSKSPVPASLANLTNKKGGKRIKIDLKKGAEGLGFTVVTRDSSVHGPGPILVKNILPRGAAIKDGRLQPGDRILEVNGVDMTGRSQEELVAMLRSTKQGESVSVVVARQEDIFLPRELKGEDAGSLVYEDGREQLMYEIPLNETGSAGLGVSLKGNRSRETGEDLGIFIKSIIHGGAAYKDGRLNVNDQMIAVNGESLLGRSNHAAMETLRRSMSSEGNSRGTIQLVVLRAPRQAQQIGGANPAPTAATNGPDMHQPYTPTSSSNQEPWSQNTYQHGPSGPSKPPYTEPTSNGPTPPPMAANSYRDAGSAGYPAATTNGGYSHYGNESEELEQSFPPPPSPGTVEEMNRDFPGTPPPHSEFQKQQLMNTAFYIERDNVPRNRASKSMDLVADEMNMGSLNRHRNELAAGGALGPTLGLMKSSSLESLQTAVSEAEQSHIKAQVPFHRPRPHMVRGRGCNQSFRIAIDKSYDGPSEDDDDLSEPSSGQETPASSSSRHGLDAEDGGKKKKKTKGKKEKKTKGKKKDDSVEDLEKKTKKKGFNLLRFGKKKDDKSKDAKAAKGKLEALSEEEVDRTPETRGSYEPRYAEILSGHIPPDPSSFPDVEDDETDPNYARINNFRQPPSPQSFISRTPSPAALTGGSNPLRASAEELDGLYAKVNKSRPPPAQQNQLQTQADSDQRLQGLRREYQQARAAPGYDELDAARRRVLEYDPNRMAPRGAESRPVRGYDDVDRQYATQPRRDPYDYPTHSRPVPREPAPQYQDPNVPSRVPLPQLGTQSYQAPNNPRYYPSPQSQHRAAMRQDVPPSPTAGRRGRQYYEAVGGRGDGYRQASPGRYISPERNRVASQERYGYGDERKADPRRKNPVIGTV